MMDMFIRNFLLVGVLLSMSCSGSGSSIDYEKIADRITAETAKKIEEETHLHLSGTGGGMMNQINMMMMAFDTYEVLDEEKVRGLLVYCVKEYLSNINRSEQVRSYLKNYPFTPEEVQIVIYIFKPDRHQVPYGEISIATAKKGALKYYTESPDSPRLKVIKEESYEEALKKVEQAK